MIRLPPPVSVLRVLGSTLSPVFSPGYAHNCTSVSKEPPSDSEVLAYMRRPMSSWFRNPSNSSQSGIPVGLSRAGTALQRLNGIASSCAVFSGSCHNMVIRSDLPLEEPSSMSASLKNNLLEPHPPCVEPDIVVDSVLPIVPESILAAVAESIFPSESLVENIQATLGLDEADLLGAIAQKPDEAVLWFDREPFVPIDRDLSNDGEDNTVSNTAKSVNIEAIILTGSSKHLRYSDIARTTITGPEYKARKTSDSGESCTTLVRRASSISSAASTSDAPTMSQEPIDFCMDNTFLGTTSIRDLGQHLQVDAKGMIAKEDLARA
jgi:hypothetical protein